MLPILRIDPASGLYHTTPTLFYSEASIEAGEDYT
jgi:hypothetical protein